jgi:peptide/nickel transport system permease protein
MILMRLTDVFVGYPALLLAIAVAAALGAGLEQAAVALATVWWAGYARLARAQAAAIRSSLSIDAARSIGATDARILIWHVLPSVIGPVIVKATLDVALVIQSIAGLGFIGLGAQPPSSEWGLMIATAEQFALTSWWYAVFPGLALFVVIEAFNLSGDALTKVWARP